MFSYKERFLAELPASRRANTDFNRPVFTAVAFYLCAKKHKVPRIVLLFWFHLMIIFMFCLSSLLCFSQLKIDKLKLIELCGTSESEFSSVWTKLQFFEKLLFLLIYFFVRCNLLNPIAYVFDDEILLLQVSSSMKDLCFDVFGISNEKKDPRSVKGHRGTWIILL